MGLLEGKRIVITGVLTDASLAFGVADLAQQEGAEIVLTGAGRGLSLTERTARKLSAPAAVLELDVTVEEHLDSVRADLQERWGRVDGVLHAIGFAPRTVSVGTSWTRHGRTSRSRCRSRRTRSKHLPIASRR